jgi:hypothetical protein
MPDTPRRSSLTLESYRLEKAPPAAEGRLAVSQAPARASIRITLRGLGFKVGARDPRIMIGDVELKDYEILSDERTIVGNLHKVPEEGSVISIEYEPGVRAELPERFSLDQLEK